MRADANGKVQTTLDFIQDILVKEMELPQDRVLIYDDRTKLPTDDGIFITIEYKGSPKVLSNRNIPQSSSSDLSEVQVVNTQEIIAIDIFSRNFDALKRKEEVLMAINSQYAQQSQEKNGFKIFRIPSGFEDLSELEGSAMIKRYEASIVVFAWYTKSKSVDYYDKFEAEISTEKDKEVPISLPN
jgi:hypothetical protein